VDAINRSIFRARYINEISGPQIRASNPKSYRCDLSDQKQARTAKVESEANGPTQNLGRISLGDRKAFFSC